MPEITRFYGIVITIAYREHNPPHFHAEYAEERASFEIKTLKKLNGDGFPARAEKLVKEWAEPHKAALLKMWNEKKVVQLPPLK